MANDDEDKKKNSTLTVLYCFLHIFFAVEGKTHTHNEYSDLYYAVYSIIILMIAFLCFLDANALTTHNKHDIILQFELCSILFFFFQFNPDRVGIFSLKMTKNSIIALLPVAVKKHVGFRNYHGECIHIVNGEALIV